MLTEKKTKNKDNVSIAEHKNSLPGIIYPFMLPVYFVIMETAARLLIFKEILDVKFILTILFSFATGFIFSGLCSLLKNGARKGVTIGLMAVFTVVYAFLTSYHRYFGTFFSWKTSEQAGNVIQYFGQNILSAFIKSWYFILLLFVPMILFIVFYRKGFYKGHVKHARVIPSIISWSGLAVCIAGIFVFWTVGNGYGFKSDYYYYKYIQNDISQTYLRYGMITTSRIEIEQMIFGEPEENLENLLGKYDINDMSDTDEGVSESDIDYGYNELYINFDKILSENGDENIQSMVKYYESLSPTNKNKYTGMFEGKNLIFLTLESFSPAVIDKDFTPILYKMSTEGFVFNNYYVPMWTGSTEAGEYANLCGNFSYYGRALSLCAQSHQTYSLGNVFTREGYDVHAYHSNTSKFYSRHRAYPALGYSQYKTTDHGMSLPNDRYWPRSDREMAEATIDDYIDSSEPFHAYYMTISGHSNYSTIGNIMSKWHYDKLPEKYSDYTEQAKCYLAANYEVELMLEYLVKRLDEAGKLEDTVFAMAPDHYPYVLKEQSQIDLLGEDVYDGYNIYRNKFILWSASMEEPVVSDKYCTSIDIVPTLLNLFGIEYDSRLVTGTDIMSNSQGIAFFRGRFGVSWITKQGTYEAKDDVFIRSKDSTLRDDETDAYVKNINNALHLKTTFARGLLEKNYYSYFIDYLER